MKNLPQEENYHFLIPSLGSPYPARNIISGSQENDNCLEDSTVLLHRDTQCTIMWRRHKSWLKKAQYIGERRRERGRYIDRMMDRLIVMAYYIRATSSERLPSCEWIVALKGQENFTEETGKNSSYLCLLGRLRRSWVRAYLQALRSGFSPTHHSCCWAEEKAKPRFLFSIR